MSSAEVPVPAVQLSVPWGRYPLCDHHLATGGARTARFMRCVCRNYGELCLGGGGVPTKSPAQKALERARLGSQLLRVITEVDHEVRLPAAPAHNHSDPISALRLVAVALFASLAAAVGIILCTVAVAHLCSPGQCGDEEEQQTTGDGAAWTPPTYMLAIPSPRPARRPSARNR